MSFYVLIEPLKVKKLRDNATIPTRGSEESAAVDLYACIDEPITIPTGGFAVIGTGIACEFPKGFFGIVAVRSSVGIKRELSLMNQIGVIDNDYRGEIKVALRNSSKFPQTIKSGERIAQMILTPYYTYDIEETDTLDETERGEGGIGSTGK